MAAFGLMLLFVPATGSIARTCNVREFGATGDGRTLETAALQRAIDACRDEGGTVLLPAGTYVSGALRLYSNINLHLESGATLKGSSDLADYQLGGRRVGLIYVEDAQNVALTGTGTIDAGGDAFMVLDRAKRIDSTGTRHTRQKTHFREVTEDLGDGPLVPYEQRPYQTIIFSNCRNVTVRDLLIVNSPFWTLHFADCDGVVVSGIRLWNSLMVPNSDGIDFTSCSNVIVSDCDIRAGDDAIVIGGYAYHFDLPGYRNLRHRSENFTVTNCTLVSRSSAIRIGGADQNSVRNITFSNIVINDSNRGIGIFAREEGSIENVLFSNIVIRTRLHTGDWWGNGEPIHLSAVRNSREPKIGQIRNVKFSNIVAEGEAGILMYGSEESLIEDVSFQDVRLHVRESALGASSGGNIDLRPVLDPSLQLFAHDTPAFYARYVRNLELDDLDLTWGAVREPFFTHGIQIDHFEDVRIDGFRGGAAPVQESLPAILLRDGRRYEVMASKARPPSARLLATQRVEQ